MLTPNQKISLSRPVEDETDDEPVNESEDMAEETAPPLPRANPHTQLDEIADAIKAGVPTELIVHEAELEANQKLRQFAARVTMSLLTMGIFIVLVVILFFFEISDSFRDLLNILVGGFLATFTKISDFWFKGDSEPTGPVGK